MKIYLIRHGESIGNVKKGFISGQSDQNGLTFKGKVQAIRTAYLIKGRKIDRIFASPVARAKETAQVIGESAGKKVEYRDFLKELSYGSFEGRYWWEVVSKFEHSRLFNGWDFNASYDQGESINQLFKRVSDGLNELLPKLEIDGEYAFVSHQAVIGCMRYYFLREDFDTTVAKNKTNDFLKFFHGRQIGNAEVIEIFRQKFKKSREQEINVLKNLKPDKRSVLFYATKILKLKENVVLKKIVTASSNIVYEIKDSSREILMKLISYKDKSALFNQIKIYEYLTLNKINVPKLIMSDDSACFFESTVVFQDYKKGSTLERSVDSDTASLKIFLKNTFNEINKIHNLNSDEIKDFWNSEEAKKIPDWSDFMTHNIQKTLQITQGFLKEKGIGDVVYRDLSNLKKYILEKKYKNVPLHGDLGTGNIVMLTDAKSGSVRIIDFEFTRFGDKLWDYVYLWGFLERESISAAKIWFDILRHKFADNLDQLFLYKTLFHVWSIRDMFDYTNMKKVRNRGSNSFRALIIYPRSYYLKN